MGEIFVPPMGGGGVSSDELTAYAYEDLVAGKTAVTRDSNDEIISGGLADKNGTTQEATATLDTANSRVQMTIPVYARYNTNSKLYTTYAKIRELIGLTAAKIATGNTILGLAGTYKGLGNAGTGDVLAGKTFSTASLSNATGTLADKSGTYTQAVASLDSTNKRVQLDVPNTAKYDTTSKLYVAFSTLAEKIGLTAAKLVSGNTILGIAGTATSDATIGQATQLRKGVVAYGKNGTKYTGTMAEQAAKTITPSESAQTAIAANTYATGAVSVAAISKTYVGSGITKQAAKTWTPGPSAQTIAAGTYLTGVQTIAAIPSKYVDLSSAKTVFNNGQFPNPNICAGFCPYRCSMGNDYETLTKSTRTLDYNNMECDFYDYVYNYAALESSIDFTKVKSITATIQVTYAYEEYEDSDGNEDYDYSIHTGYVSLGLYDVSTKKRVLYESQGKNQNGSNTWIAGDTATVTLDTSSVTGYHFVSVGVEVSSVGDEEIRAKIVSITIA